MRRLFLVLLVCSIPALLFVNAWQTFRFNEALKEVRVLENRQRELIETNRNTLVGIEVLSSPSRIDEIAEGMEAIEKGNNKPRVLIQIDAATGEAR